MILWYLLLPPVIAVLWRFARGEGKWKRWQFYVAMFWLALIVSSDTAIALGFLLLVAGLAVPPNNALGCAVTGRPPERKDSAAFQWMQRIALTINRALPSLPVTPLWWRYGIIYGAIRSLWTWPGVFWLLGYHETLMPLFGLFLCAHGLIYFIGGALARRFTNHEGMGIVYAELMTGYLAACYLLIVAAG